MSIQKASYIFIFLISSSFFSFIFSEPQESCTYHKNAFPPQTISNSPNFYPSSFIFNMINYGIPFVIEKVIFLPLDVKLSKYATYITDNCPPGYRLVNREEYDSVLKSLGTNADTILKNKDQFNFTDSAKYLTSDNSGKDYFFYSLSKNKTECFVDSIMSNTVGSDYRGKCVRDFSLSILDYSNAEFDLTVEEKREVTLENSYFKGFLIRLDNKIYTKKI